METSPLTPIENQRFREQSAFKDWMNEKFNTDYEDGRCFSVTLSFVADISRQSAETQFRNYILYVNRLIYGKAHKRFPKEKNLKLVSVIEGGGNSAKQVHYHLIVVNPRDRSFTDEEFSSIIKLCLSNGFEKFPLKSAE